MLRLLACVEMTMPDLDLKKIVHELIFDICLKAVFNLGGYSEMLAKALDF